MEVERLTSVPLALALMMGCSVIAENLMVETAMAAQKYLLWLLFLIGSLSKDADCFSNAIETEKRFPFDDLTKVTKPDPENKDASETDDDDDDDEDASDSDSDDNDENGDDSSGEEGSDDDEGGPDGNSNANANGRSDDEDNDDDEDDEDDDEEDLARPPLKKRK